MQVQEDTEEKSSIGMPTTQSQVTPKEDDIRTATIMQLNQGIQQKTALVWTKWLQILGVQYWWKIDLFCCIFLFTVMKSYHFEVKSSDFLVLLLLLMVLFYFEC